MCTNEMVTNINAALGAHGAWKLRLKTAIALGNSSISAEAARCDKSCEFGRWLHGTGIDAATRRGVPYAVVTRLHREFHDTASTVVTLATAGQRAEAERLLAGEFTQRSETLARALTKWRNEVAGS